MLLTLSLVPGLECGTPNTHEAVLLPVTHSVAVARLAAMRKSDLHVKRDRPNRDLSVSKPCQDFVSFPARGLDMGKYLTGWPAAGAAPAAPPPSSDAEGRATGPPRPSASSPPPPKTRPTAAATAEPRLSGDVPAPSLPYDLLAVVNHSGGMAQGHYTAYVKEIGRWFRFDDTWVHEVSEEEVLASEAYILFYFQRGADAAWRPPPPEALPQPPPPAAGKRRLTVP